MNYNDYNKAITAEDLIRRYNLNNLSSDRKNIKETKKELEKVNHTTNQFVESVLKSLEELQDQVDGNIITWFFNEVPNLENYPASDWTTEKEKNNHLGDLYYDNSTGYAYRFVLENQEYKWIKIVDSDVVEALAIANAAQDTADKKRQVFVVTPTPPYEVGDIWIKDDKDIYRCRAKRADGEYSSTDWIKASDYTNDDYAKNVESVLNQFKTTVESDYATKVLLETSVDSINASVEAVTKKTETLENKLSGKADVINVETLTQRVDTVQTATSQNTTAIEELKVNDEVQEQKITEFEITVDGVTSTVTKQNDKISQVTQTVEELNSKIGDIADITPSKESDTASLEFEGINQSEPIRIVIRPIGESISYLYPSDNLFPSDTLYLKTRTIRFENKTTGKIFDYELPDDLLYYDNENYDEFILDYDKQSCIVNKKVGYNSDGTTYVLDAPRTLKFEYPTGDKAINLTDGDYKVYVLGYENAYIFVRLMAQTQFASKTEVSQTANKINSEVNQKLKNYSTTTEMNNKISQEITDSENKINIEVNKKLNSEEFTGANILLEINNDKSSATINANKINMNGEVIDLNATDFSLVSDLYNNNLYSQSDVSRIQSIILGTITATQTDYDKYDITGDGTINVQDLLYISRWVNGALQQPTSQNPYKFKIGASTKMQPIIILDNYGNVVTKIGGMATILRDLVVTSGSNLATAQAYSLTIVDEESGNMVIQLQSDGSVLCESLDVTGSKNRLVTLDNGTQVRLGAYETATPYFGDIGSNKTDINGYCKIEIEDIFGQTIEKDDYKVFIQECGEGHLYIEKYENYFEVKGTPNLNFDWELKAIQKGYKDIRLQKKESDK